MTIDMTSKLCKHRGMAVQAFRQRQEMKCHKDIDRRKVEHSIKEFVRATVHRLRDRR